MATFFESRPDLGETSNTRVSFKKFLCCRLSAKHILNLKVGIRRRMKKVWHKTAFWCSPVSRNRVISGELAENKKFIYVFGTSIWNTYLHCVHLHSVCRVFLLLLTDIPTHSNTSHALHAVLNTDILYTYEYCMYLCM